ncbi:MAG TPA: sodium:proton antiporter [Rubrobacteraceae bacterium]|nr:sodium:proton antiporter [Rubrobacteraceae bacterium]
MILIISLVISLIFGAGAFLILQRDLFRVVIGIVLISNAANLFIIASGLSRGEPPIYPLPEGSPVSDPLVQAMALTAIVISFSVAVLLLGLVYRLYTSHGTVDLEDISEMEVREAEVLERESDPQREEEPASEPEEVELREDTR